MAVSPAVSASRPSSSGSRAPGRVHDQSAGDVRAGARPARRASRRPRRGRRRRRRPCAAGPAVNRVAPAGSLTSTPTSMALGRPPATCAGSSGCRPSTPASSGANARRRSPRHRRRAARRARRSRCSGRSSRAKTATVPAPGLRADPRASGSAWRRAGWARAARGDRVGQPGADGAATASAPAVDRAPLRRSSAKVKRVESWRAAGQQRVRGRRERGGGGKRVVGRCGRTPGDRRRAPRRRGAGAPRRRRRAAPMPPPWRSRGARARRSPGASAWPARPRPPAGRRAPSVRASSSIRKRDEDFTHPPIGAAVSASAARSSLRTRARCRL